MNKAVSVSMMRQVEDATINSGISAIDLMFSAAKGIYDSYNWSGKIAIVCGSGNNGGDGIALATLLADNGISVDLYLTSDHLKNEGLFYLNQAKNKKINIIKICDDFDFDNYDIIVDALLGIGFKGDLRESVSKIIIAINNSRAFKICIDINSGVDADNGTYSNAVFSDLTVAIGAIKTGQLLNFGKDVYKKIVIAQMPFDFNRIGYGILDKAYCKKAFLPRKSSSYKNTFGKVSLIGGSVKYMGAISLATMASIVLVSGAGLVNACIPSSFIPYFMPHNTDATIFPMSDDKGQIKYCKGEIEMGITGSKTVVIGMGLGDNYEAILSIIADLLKLDINIVIDADGINALSKNVSLLSDKKANVILTPHIKEFSRLLNISTSNIVKDPVFYVAEFAKKYDVTMLLKGSSTIISNGCEVKFVTNGIPAMAVGGSGDVLSGIIGALFARFDDGLFCAATGAYLAAQSSIIALENINEYSLRAIDTISNLKMAIKNVMSE